MTAGPGEPSPGPAVLVWGRPGTVSEPSGRCGPGAPGAVTRVTAPGFDLARHLDVIFWMSARQGGTDTTAKLLGAAAKWLVPRAGHPHELQVLDLSTREGTGEGTVSASAVDTVIQTW